MKIVVTSIFVAVCAVSIVTHVGMAYLMARSGMEMSNHGHIAMALGIFFTYGVGAALMALLFFSNKNGHDEQVHTLTDTAPSKTSNHQH